MHTVIGTLVLSLYLFAIFSGLYWVYDWYRDDLQRLVGAPVISKAKPVEVPRKPPEDAAIEHAWNAFLDNVSNYGAATLRIDDVRTGQADINQPPAGAPHDRTFNRLALDTVIGAVLHNEPLAAKPPMQRLLASTLPLHSGHYFGPIGAVLMLIGALMLPIFATAGQWLYLDWHRRVQPQREHTSVVTCPC